MELRCNSSQVTFVFRKNPGCFAGLFLVQRKGTDTNSNFSSFCFHFILRTELLVNHESCCYGPVSLHKVTLFKITLIPSLLNISCKHFFSFFLWSFEHFLYCQGV